MCEEDWENILNEADKEKDGRISKSEFMSIFQENVKITEEVNKMKLK